MMGAVSRCDNHWRHNHLGNCFLSGIGTFSSVSAMKQGKVINLYIQKSDHSVQGRISHICPISGICVFSIFTGDIMKKLVMLS